MNIQYSEKGSNSSSEQVGNLFSTSKDDSHAIPLIEYRWIMYLSPEPFKTFPHEWIDGNVFTSNAEYLDVTIRLYKDDEVKSSFVFRDIILAGINNSTLELTTDMEYKYVSGS